MNPPGPTLGWSNARLAWSIVLLTAVQCAVVLRFGTVPEIPLPRSAPHGRTTLLWSTDQMEQAFVGVPRSRRDVLERDPGDAFQSVALRSVPAPEYRLAEWREPDRWLTNPPVLRPVDVARPALPDSSAASTPPPRVLARPAASQQTRMLLGGALSGRAWLKPPVLGPWPGPESPGVTRLEAAVNPQGWIVVLRVSDGSGSRDADDAALAAFRSALLVPEPGAPKRPSFDATRLAWGTVTVAWGLPPSGS
jgi:hypothetical protein